MRTAPGSRRGVHGHTLAAGDHTVEHLVLSEPGLVVELRREHLDPGGGRADADLDAGLGEPRAGAPHRERPTRR